MADNQTRPINIGKKIGYKDDHDLYIVQLVHHRRPWWLLLLLLPLLLLIQCHKDISVSCMEPDTGAPIIDQPVTMEYQSHFIWNNGRFFPSDSIKLTQNTDSTGNTVFKDLPCSVYSYIFYCLSKALFTAKSECYASVEEKHNFHYTRHVDLKMPPRREDLHVKILDLETNDPLPGAILRYRYEELGEVKEDSAEADPAGVATIPQMRYCSVMKLLHGSLYGYADTTKADVPCQKLLVPDDSTALRLRPIKERFTFFVKNVETKEPITGANCWLTLNDRGRTVKYPKPIITSVAGKGIAVIDAIFILAEINTLLAQKRPHYADSTLQGCPWRVDKFILQDDDTRTIWLRPLPYTDYFINVDSITGKPIPGVNNYMTITNPATGDVKKDTAISNSNGVFPVSAKEDEKVEIISDDAPCYKRKFTSIPVFKNVTTKKIPMAPEMVTLQFRTVRAEKPGQLLPNCNLRVTGSISGNLQPTNSGNGVFNVTFRKCEQLTIAASRKGYKNTTNKVTSQTWNYLKDDQSRRDIPLKQDLPPCSAGKNTPKGANEMHHDRTYGMGKEEGCASIWVDFYGEPDHLKVIDGEGNVLINRDIKNKNEGGANPIKFCFKGGSVRVIIDTSTQNGSSWEYILNCPD